MNLADVLQALILLVLGWIATELRTLRSTLTRQGERLSALEARVDERGHHAGMRPDAVIALVLVLLVGGLSACAAAGGALLGGAAGGALGGPAGAAAGALGGLIGSCWTTIVSGFHNLFSWLGSEPHQAPQVATAAASLLWPCALAAAVLWLLVHGATPATFAKFGKSAAQAGRALLRRRPAG